MKKVLIISELALGDCIACTLILAKNFAKTSRVDCITGTMSAYRVLREVPCFYSVIHSGNHQPEMDIVPFEKFVDIHVEKYSDLVKIFSLYDNVCITRTSHYNHIKEYIAPEFIQNVIKPIDFKPQSPMSRSEIAARNYEFKEHDYSLNIDWYKKYYTDFHCHSKTVLVNGTSDDAKRSFKKINEVIKSLELLGFDVRQIDVKTDIRINLHLINQCKYVLTTDTSTYWFAKALGKTPQIFIGHNMYTNEVAEALLECKNIITNKGDMDKIEPQEIVDGFLKAIHYSQKRKLFI